MFNINSGETIKYLTVRILNNRNEELIELPGTNRKYQVKLSSPTMDVDFGKSNCTYTKVNTPELFEPTTPRSKGANKV